MSQPIEAPKATPSRLIAREIRAELGRQQLSQRRLALALGTNYQWVQRRVSIGAEIELTFDDTQRIANALGVPVRQLLSGWLGDSASPTGSVIRAYRDESYTIRNQTGADQLDLSHPGGMRDRRLTPDRRTTARTAA
jgi:transcriptional regulator with XRE-family HTH domain